MRILVIVSGPAQGSGVRSAARSLDVVLESLGHEVGRLAVDTQPRRAGNRLNSENVRSVARDVRDTWRSVGRERPDLVWLHSLGYPLLPAARTVALLLALRFRRVVTVSHLHAYGLDEKALRDDRAGRFAVRLLCGLSGRVVVLHDRSAHAVQRLAPQGRIVVLPNIVDVPEEPVPLPRGDRFRLVFVGGLVRRKGVPELLDAMRLLDDSYELHLVGGPGEDGVAAAEELVAGASNLVATGRVVFEGELGDAGVRAQLRAADLFVLPSRSEGTPISLLEAMAEGRPVLVGEGGNMPEIVAQFRCGEVLRSVRAHEIARAIRLLANDPVGLTERGRRSHAAALREFSAAAIAPSMGQVLRCAQDRD